MAEVLAARVTRIEHPVIAATEKARERECVCEREKARREEESVAATRLDLYLLLTLQILKKWLKLSQTMYLLTILLVSLI